MAIALGGFRYRDTLTMGAVSNGESGIVSFTTVTNVRAVDGVVSACTIAANAANGTMTLAMDFSSLPANATIESISITMRARANRDVTTQSGTPGLEATWYRSAGTGGSSITTIGFSKLGGVPNTANTLEDWASGIVAGSWSYAQLSGSTVALVATADDTLSMTFGVDCVTCTVVYNA